MRSIWIGFDDREVLPYLVAKRSIRFYSSVNRISPVHLGDLIGRGWYTRQTRYYGKRLFDVISDAPMSTQFAISRFFVPRLVESKLAGSKQPHGWALFMDSDILCLDDLDALFNLVEAHPDKALFCVKHNHVVDEFSPKKDGQIQVNYSRKNWSSVMAFNCDHPSNQALTLEKLNTLYGRDLHRFCWLEDEEIGELDLRWNVLVGISPPVERPAIVHFTEGGPWLPKYQDVPYADDWRHFMISMIND